MNRAALLLPLLATLFATGPLGAQENSGVMVPTVSTTPSENYPQVTCSSTDPAIVNDALQLAEDTREQLAPLLKLGPTWRFPVRIHVVTPDDPLRDRVHDEDVAAILTGKTVEIDLALPSSDPGLHEAIQRQYVTALLWEKFFPQNQVFTAQTRLDIIPVWLIEGLREWLNEDPDNTREAIVKRAVATQTTPSLADISSWQELSSDRLQGLWQRAFCYYLVSSLVHTGPHRADFQEWLSNLTGPNPPAANYLFPSEGAWQRELLEAPERSLELIYTWDQTASEFNTAQTFTLAVSHSKEVRTCTLDELAAMPLDDLSNLSLDKTFVEALNQKIFVLTGLELRAHYRWRPIIALYRFALAGLVANKNPTQTQKLFEEARHDHESELGYRQKLTDYANWFEVTHDDSTTSHFNSYFNLAQELERAQTPKPNPIRATALQVESQLTSGN